MVASKLDKRCLHICFLGSFARVLHCGLSEVTASHCSRTAYFSLSVEVRIEMRGAVVFPASLSALL